MFWRARWWETLRRDRRRWERWRASAWLRRTNEKRLEAKSRSEAEAEDLSF